MGVGSVKPRPATPRRRLGSSLKEEKLIWIARVLSEGADLLLEQRLDAARTIRQEFDRRTEPARPPLGEKPGESRCSIPWLGTTRAACHIARRLPRGGFAG